MTYCQLQIYNVSSWWCPECDPKKKRLLPVRARRNCSNPLPLPGRVRHHLQQRTDVTRPQPELDRLIAFCLEQCDKLGTGQWGEVNYEGCPRFGRPCTGAFEKWMKALADVNCWCDKWGEPEK